MSDINWCEELNSLSILEATEKFYSILLTIIDNEVPKKHYKLSTFPNWFSRNLINLIFSKKLNHQKYKHYLELNDADNITIYKSKFIYLRAQCKKEMKKCYKNYVSYIENCLSNNVKKFWDFIRSKSNANGYPSKMHFENIYAVDSSSIANLFKVFFSSVYSENSFNSQPLIFPTDLIPNDMEISTEEILKSITKSKLSFNPGTDGIPSAFLKHTSSQIVLPLHILFCKSLSEGKSHYLWKNSTITPIFKSGDRSDIKNYRPITNINTIPSLLDDIIANKLASLCCNKISSCQHGFIKGRSTVSNLSIHTHNIVNAINNHSQYDTIYTDFKKAFDLVNHSVLINKLVNMQIPLYIVKWIQDYLSDRFSSIKIHNSFSDTFKIPCGVPQGSHIGPILFILFINDLLSEIQFSNCLLFADDCKLSYLINSLDDCMKLQSDLIKICEWCNLNGMQINIKKCFVISFSRSYQLFNYDYKIDNQSLTRVSKMKDLGVIFDSRLTFTPHLDSIISRANRNWFFICRQTKDFNDPTSIKILYLSLVRSILTYASSIWRPVFKFDLTRLERVQHKALRRISFLDGAPINRFSHDYSRVSLKFNIPSLTSLYDSIDSIYIYKIMYNSQTNNPIKNMLPLNSAPYPTRYYLPFYTPIRKNNFSCRDPIYRFCDSGNKIVLFKPFLSNWNITINVASNLINSFILNFS